MIKFGVFYHQSWDSLKYNIPLPDLNYVRTNEHKPKENAIDIFNSRMDAQNRCDLLNSRRASNETGQYYVAPTMQEYNGHQKKYHLNGQNLSGWKK